MPRDKQVERLMEKLLRTIEASLAARDAAREVVGEILRQGAENRVACRVDDAPGVSDAFTDLDRQFLRSFFIRPENR
jgi:hypothetical protein